MTCHKELGIIWFINFAFSNKCDFVFTEIQIQDLLFINFTFSNKCDFVFKEIQIQDLLFKIKKYLSLHTVYIQNKYLINCVSVFVLPKS